MLPMIQMSSGTSNVPKRRPPNIRYRRNARVGFNEQQKPINTTGEPSPDDLFRVLVMAAESYVHLNQLQ